MNLERLSSSGLAIPLAMALARVVPEPLLLRTADALAARTVREASPSVMAVRANQAVVRDLPKDDPEIDRAVQAVFQNAGRGQVDLFRALARGREALLRGCEVAPEMIGRIEQARGEGRGLILVGPHIGAFDFFMLTIAARGYPLYAISPANPTSTYRMQNYLRTRFGAETVPASTEAFRESTKRLLKGGLVGTGTDRPIETKQRIEFFGRPAALPTAFARLAIHTNSLVLPGAVLPDGPNHYRTEALELIEPPKKRTDGAILSLTREVLRLLEPIIRAHADHWLMFFPVWPDA